MAAKNFSKNVSQNKYDPILFLAISGFHLLCFCSKLAIVFFSFQFHTFGHNFGLFREKTTFVFDVLTCNRRHMCV